MRGPLRSTAFGSRRGIILIFATVVLGSLWATGADAVSLRVKLACSIDYHALCSQYASDSPEVRQCMRAAGEKLSPRCLNALIAEGEVSEEEVARRAALLRQ
jgi:hypothetical protein